MSSLQVFTGPWLGEFAIELPDSMSVSGPEFEEICRRNPDLRAELTSEGNLIIMPPTGGTSGRRSGELFGQVWDWTRNDGTGVAFDSSTVFALPNGARRSPDVAWVRRERWDALAKHEQEGFPPLCPDFVIELRSTTDRLAPLQAKLAEFIENGAVLGFLVDPAEMTAHVYRPGAEPQVIAKPDALTGDPELPGLFLDLARIWSDGR